MATVNLGRIKPVFRGAYSGSTAYVIDDIVTHGNESFICIQAHGAGTQATSVTAYWTKLAAKGTDGTDVGTTITTQGDILFRDGSGLQRLAKGTALYGLRMNAGATAPEWAEASSGKTIKRHYFINSTRTAGNSTADTNQFTMTSGFIPVDPVNNDLWVEWISPINSAGQSWSCIGVRMSKSGGSDYEFRINAGMKYSGDTSNQAIQGGDFHVAAGTIPAGTYTIYIRNYESGSAPNYWSINTTDEARVYGQQGTTMMIEEYKN